MLGEVFASYEMTSIATLNTQHSDIVTQSIQSVIDSNNLASQTWVENKGYLTSHQSLSNYATLSSAQTISNKTIDSSCSINSLIPTVEAPTIQTARSGLWSSICYGNNHYVCVGSRTEIMYSTDAVNWGYTSTTDTYTSASICYGNNKFMGICVRGTYKYLITSTDGETFSDSDAFPITMTPTCICFGNGVYLIGGYNSSNTVIAYSTTGEASDWTEVVLTTTGSINAICMAIIYL